LHRTRRHRCCHRLVRCCCCSKCPQHARMSCCRIFDEFVTGSMIIAELELAPGASKSYADGQAAESDARRAFLLWMQQIARNGLGTRSTTCVQYIQYNECITCSLQWVVVLELDRSPNSVGTPLAGVLSAVISLRIASSACFAQGIHADGLQHKISSAREGWTPKPRDIQSDPCHPVASCGSLPWLAEALDCAAQALTAPVYKTPPLRIGALERHSRHSLCCSTCTLPCSL
jgi:hypothetical protein